MLVGATGVTFTLLEAAPVPAAFVAVTLQLYCTAFVIELTMIGLVVPVPVRVVSPAAVQVTVYPVIAEPPFDAGAVNEIVACAFPGLPVPIVGAPGTVRGVTVTLPDAAPVPCALVALTLHVYCVPFVIPVTLTGLADAVAVCADPVVGVHVAV